MILVVVVHIGSDEFVTWRRDCEWRLEDHALRVVIYIGRGKLTDKFEDVEM